jgi:hypothetical protein
VISRAWHCLESAHEWNKQLAGIEMTSFYPKKLERKAKEDNKIKVRKKA